MNWRAQNYETEKENPTNPEKGHKKTSMKLDDPKMDFLIFSEMHVRKRPLFCPISPHNVPYEKQQELNKWSKP